MLKKWLIVAIVLSCTIFVVSSGCSEKSKENTSQSMVENTSQSADENTNQSVVENTNQSADENTKVNTSIDKSTGDSGTSSKDISGKESNVKIESTDSSGAKTETNIVSTGSSSDWCAVGSSWSTVNPQTGEMSNMKVTGIETVDGIPMCKAVYETNDNSSNYTKLEYFWSEDGKTSLWTAYDATGKKISEVSMKDGKMRVVDKDGKVTEISTQS